MVALLWAPLYLLRRACLPMVAAPLYRRALWLAASLPLRRTSQAVKLRDAACAYAELGWSIFPVSPGQKRPAGNLVPRGMNDSTSELGRVFKWWEWMPYANIGVNCERSGMVVLDIDPRHGGDDSLYELVKELGALPVTVEAFSGGGGQHMLFVNERVSYRRELAPGVDIKANGYIVLPPSVHPSGERYEWSVDGDPHDVGIARLPEAWHQRMRVRTRAETPALAETNDDLKMMPARRYFEVLTKRLVNVEGWAQCPFHKNGEERTPSLYCRGTLWACYACEPQAGKRCLGGNIFDLAGLLWGYPLPLTRFDYGRVRTELERVFS